MHRNTDFTLVVQLVCIIVTLTCVSGYTKYRTCADVKKALGANATDKEYPLFINSNVAVPIYCYGFNRADNGPAEYITLRSGRSSNFASFYENVGDSNSCADRFPRQLYDRRGRSEFSRIGVEIFSLVVQTGDFTFANQTGHRQVRYGNGGDMFSNSPACEPKGGFVIDLSGTPFALVKGTQWTWQGRYFNDGITQGKVKVDDHSYVGCFPVETWTWTLKNGMNSDSMSIDRCKKYCSDWDYTYCGLTGNSCNCGTIYDRHSASYLSDDQCSIPCSGNSSTKCGGPNGVNSVYKTVVPQRYTVRCGGYPAQCFAITNESFKMETLQLDVMNGQHICMKKNPCLNEGGCLALNRNEYKCLCYNGYTGARCEQILDTLTVKNSTCPMGYQAEACACQTSNCISARFTGDTCQAKPSPSVTCRPASPGQVYLFNVQGTGSISCPSDSDLVGCSKQRRDSMYGRGNVFGNDCRSCKYCRVQARCKKHDCGCQNGGHCNKVTGLCECPPSYNGDKCEMFDFCRFYEARHNNTPACTSGGICTAVKKRTIKTIGGDMAGDTCIFPFDYGTRTYYSCVEDNYNSSGPPFACSGRFDQSSSYIDLGQWSPGQKYTIAAWVKPAVIDTIRRTIAGGASECNDFGFNLNSGTFRGFKKMSTECTEDLDAGKPYVQVGKWYMVAISSNASHIMIYQDGKLRNMNTVLLNHLPTTSGFRIGGELCCPNDYFHGMIKTVKVWNHDLTADEINASMYKIGTANSTIEALHNGLVGHWELGDVPHTPCEGDNVINHGGGDWILTDGVYISGVHCNIKRFVIPKGATVLIAPYDGSKGGLIDITAETIHINGILDGGGAGYRGGPSPNVSGSGGLQGESYNGVGQLSLTANRGGGGGGKGALGTSDGFAGPGGGATYKSDSAFPGYSRFSEKVSSRARGLPYGTDMLDVLYLGSGGGSGGNSKELAYTPKGGKGGNGGGAVRLAASRSVVVTGLIKVNGETGQGDTDPLPSCLKCPSACFQRDSRNCVTNSTTGCWDLSGPGGGGSGGSIYLSADYVDIGHANLWIQGGKGGMGGKQCGGYGSQGRVRVDSNMYKGQITQQGIDTFYRGKLQELFADYSQTGQKQIDYTNTVYGNEVYRGCFIQSSTQQVLSVSIPTTQVTKQQMTPQYCQQMCRQRKYMFSGTENGQSCYCDNHLVLSSKAPDSDCSVACLGDPFQKCGGTNRLQVFGPPPTNPAKGFNVRPMCEPWCVTADALSAKPKWGTCVEQSSSVSSWDIKCECPPGKIGKACDQECPMWSYGLGCRRQCNCNQTNSAGCVPSTGVCKCKPGYQGDQCEKVCAAGYFGENCANQCTCFKGQNSHNSECDPISGTCSCQSGWYGDSCSFPCQQNTFGKNCSSTCQCSRHGTCDPVDGTCQCRPGYDLPFCTDKCDPYSYGQDCLQKCDCNNQPCDAVTGVCQCGPGYTGTRCEQLCSFGKYGQKCAGRCNCQSGFACDHITGECKCGRGYLGEDCGLQCPALSYGQDCQNQCKCIRNHTDVCDAVNGECFCLPGYQGQYCERTCDSGYYGERCKSTCNCKNGATCDSVAGTCICAPGFVGDQCQIACPPSHYGNQCKSRCPSSCPNGNCNTVDGSCNCQKSVACTCPKNTWGTLSQCDQICSCVNGRCNPSDGSCICSPGWTGNHCEMPCPDGTFGRNCGGTCRCVQGTCDPISGGCRCKNGYNGTLCDATCPSGTYGPNCIYPCAQCGPYSYPGCEPHTGACLCSDGYAGPTCDRPCPEGTFGAKCMKNCTCQNDGYCDSVTGKCLCSPGFYGVNCENTCQPGSWGANCTRACSCGPYGDGCSPREGLCRCKPGFVGVKCRQSCASGYYGQNCTSHCNCDPFSSTCSPIDGKCLCNSGYKGQYCDQACGSGYWGKNCSQPCLCNERGTCNPFTGECDCEPGYKGKQCQTQCDQDIYWGRNCASKCSCNGANCDHRDGTCRCPPGKMGHQCEQGCDSQHFGFQCAQLCGCQNSGQCDAVTGTCRCQPGWSGQFCSETCPNGYYGNDCSLSCPECQNGGSCDSLSGTCNCAPGFGGPLCNITLAAVTERQADVQKLVSQSGIHFTSPQLAGLIIGFIIVLVIVAMVTALVTRRHYFGRFGSAPGAMKFKGEEDEDTEDQGNKAGFSNPVLEVIQLESRQELSNDTPGESE